MAVSKVDYFGQTLIDITDSLNIIPDETLLYGTSAYDKTGTMKSGLITHFSDVVTLPNRHIDNPNVIFFDVKGEPLTYNLLFCPSDPVKKADLKNGIFNMSGKLYNARLSDDKQGNHIDWEASYPGGEPRSLNYWGFHPKLPEYDFFSKPWVNFNETYSGVSYEIESGQNVLKFTAPDGYHFIKNNKFDSFDYILFYTAVNVEEGYGNIEKAEINE